jgi:hypothetical protein
MFGIQQLAHALLCLFFSFSIVTSSRTRLTCVVPAAGNASVDDAPAILSAFNRCGRGGHIIFTNTTYNINSTMNTTGLSDVQIDIYGTLLVGLTSDENALELELN